MVFLTICQILNVDIGIRVICFIFHVKIFICCSILFAHQTLGSSNSKEFGCMKISYKANCNEKTKFIVNKERLDDTQHWDLISC